jgi:hypothetical protein
VLTIKSPVARNCPCYPGPCYRLCTYLLCRSLKKATGVIGLIARSALEASTPHRSGSHYHSLSFDLCLSHLDSCHVSSDRISEGQYCGEGHRRGCCGSSWTCLHNCPFTHYLRSRGLQILLWYRAIWIQSLPEHELGSISHTDVFAPPRPFTLTHQPNTTIKYSTHATSFLTHLRATNFGTLSVLQAETYSEIITQLCLGRLPDTTMMLWT